MSINGSRVAAVIVIAGLAARTPLAAQGLETSRIHGVVRDGTASVIVDATVTLRGTHLGGSRESPTDDRGQFYFPILPAGTYELTVDAAGFARAIRSGIVVALDTTVRIDVSVMPAPVVDAVDVTTAAPVLDLRRSAVVTNVDEAMLQSLPVKRELGEVLALAPGIMNPTPVPGLVVAFGGTSGSNGLYVDGVDVTEPRRQGPWLPVNYNWLEQVQVVSLGAGAQYAEFTGALANATLRSGRDRFAGLAEYWTTRWRWVDRNGSSIAGREILSWWDSSAQLGGPIRRQRAWFFGGLQFYRKEDRPTGFNGPGTASEQNPRAILKLTTAVSEAARLEGHVQYNSRNVEAANASQSVSASAWNEIEQRDRSWNVRLTRTLGQRTFFEARSGGFTTLLDEGPRSPNTVEAPPPSYDERSQVWSANASSYERRDVTQLNSAAKVTREVERLLGSHSFEAAVEFKLSQSANASGYPGGRLFVTNNGRVVRLSEWAGDRTKASGRRTALYAQDRWTLSPRVTVNAGLRIDVNRASIPRQGTILSTNPLSPRVGVAWTLDNSHRTVLKLHAGRYYDALLMERVAFMDVAGLNPRINYLVGADGERTPLGTPPSTTARAIDPDIRHSHMKQYVVALEREISRHTLLQALYTRSSYADFMGMIDTGSVWTPTQIQDPGPDAVFQTADDVGFFTAYRNTNPGNRFLYYTNPTDAFRRYDGLQVAASKRMSDNWHMQGSFTWSKTLATAGNSDFTNAGLNDTGDVTQLRFPSVFVNPNGLINAEGRAPYEVRELKVLGSYRLPVAQGVLMSGILRRHGGNRWERTVQYRDVLIPGDFQTIRVEPRGSRITRRVWNLDLRFEKTIRASGANLGVALDLFNVMNQGEPLQVVGISGPFFGFPNTRNDPRLARLMVRYTF
jgi:hypothetical protein